MPSASQHRFEWPVERRRWHGAPSWHTCRERGAEDRRKVSILAIQTPEHDQAAGGIFAPLMRAVEEDLAGYGEDERALALVLEFMERHAATRQRITIDVRKADDPGSR